MRLQYSGVIHSMLIHIIISNTFYSSVLRSNLLLPWLQSLPDLFVKIEASNPETSARIIVAMAAAAVAGDRAHLQGLQKNMGHLLGMCTGSKNGEPVSTTAAISAY